MIGFLLGIVKNLFFIGYSLIESIVFYYAYGYLMPYIAKSYGVSIPELTYWHCFSLFILIHFVGKFIKLISPFNIKIKNSSESE